MLGFDLWLRGQGRWFYLDGMGERGGSSSTIENRTFRSAGPNLTGGLETGILA